MEFKPKIKVKSLSTKNIEVPNEYKLEDNKIKVIETMKREGVFYIPEAKKIIHSLNDKINFHKFEISETRIKEVKTQISHLETKKHEWEKIIKEAELKNINK